MKHEFYVVAKQMVGSYFVCIERVVGVDNRGNIVEMGEATANVYHNWNPIAYLALTEEDLDGDVISRVLEIARKKGCIA